MADASALKSRFIRQAQDRQRRAAERTRADAEAAAPKDTGQLSRAVFLGPQTTSNGVISTPIAIRPNRSPSTPDNLAVAAFNERGTRAKTIRPKTPGGTLRWTQGGKVRFAKVVHQPARPARPWFYPALRRWSRNVRERR